MLTNSRRQTAPNLGGLIAPCAYPRAVDVVTKFVGVVRPPSLCVGGRSG